MVKIIVSSTGRPEDENRIEAMIDSAEDLSSIPENAAPGSIAYTASLSAIYQKALDGTWAQIGA